jgi:hypothetical protein
MGSFQHLLNFLKRTLITSTVVLTPFVEMRHPDPRLPDASLMKHSYQCQKFVISKLHVVADPIDTAGTRSSPKLAPVHTCTERSQASISEGLHHAKKCAENR